MMQIQHSQSPFGSRTNMADTLTNPGSCKPWFMPPPPPPPFNHQKRLPPSRPYQPPQFLPPPQSFYPSPQTPLPPYSAAAAPLFLNNTTSTAPPQGMSPLSALLNSLMAQGVISLNNQTAVKQEEEKESIGGDIAGINLNKRRESVLKSLYAHLSRQCATCGMRFKSQEEHRTHMDWHVQQNRKAKSRKQKHASQQWYRTASMYLNDKKESETGCVFTKHVADKKRKIREEDFAIPADENQSDCALCMEAFEDFYSHETEEWMYKDAVYLNASERVTPDMDQSGLGPIVHAKCRSNDGQSKRQQRS